MLKHPIYNEDRVIGEAELVQEGMVWKISCVCDLNNTDPLRIWAIWPGGKIELGLCIAEKEQKKLIKRVPKRIIPLDEVRFCVRKEDADEIVKKNFLEIEDISSLRYARYEPNKDGGCLKFDQSSSKPTGQWSEPNTSE